MSTCLPRQVTYLVYLPLPEKMSPWYCFIMGQPPRNQLATIAAGVNVMSTPQKCLTHQGSAVPPNPNDLITAMLTGAYVIMSLCPDRMLATDCHRLDAETSRLTPCREEFLPDLNVTILPHSDKGVFSFS